MNKIFYQSEFNGDLSQWKPYRLIKAYEMFEDAKCSVPYWGVFFDPNERNQAIVKYILNARLNKELNEDLKINEQNNLEKKLKL